MRCHRLYCPTLQVGTVELPAEEAHHAISVLRIRSGTTVTLFDGAGREASAIIDAMGRHKTTADVETVATRPFDVSPRITLAVAMGRAHRQGYLVEKCTELGVSAIWPIIAARSVSKPDAGSILKWTRRAVEAAKQSQRAWVPEITAPQTFDESVTRASEFEAACIAHRDPDSIPLGPLLEDQVNDARVLVWVGPEGGWSDDEVNKAVDAGAATVTLGPTILRTETAAVAVCAAAAARSIVWHA